MQGWKLFIITFFVSFLFALGKDAGHENIAVMVHTGHPLKSASVSYDGKYIFSRNDAEICVWDMKNLMLLKTLGVHTRGVYAHPSDSRLIYIALKDNPYSSRGASYAIMDWTTEEVIGYVESDHKPLCYAVSDLEVLPAYDDIIALLSRDINGKLVGALGGISLDVGTAKTNYNDSLLITSGLFPMLWDLKNLRLAGSINYWKYLENSDVADYKKIHRLPYSEGFRPSVISYYESNFIPESNDVILGGVRDTITVWHIGNDGQLTLARELPVGAGPSPILTFQGDTIVAATEVGLFRSINFGEFEKLDKVSNQAGTISFNTVSRPYGQGLFLAGNNFIHNKVKTDLVECKFDGTPTGRVGNKRHNYLADIKIAPKEDFAVVTFGQRGVACVDLSGDSLRYETPKKTYWLENEKITRCEVLPDETIVGGSTLGALSFWKRNEDECFKIMRDVHHGSINSITLTSDSTKMITADNTGQITLWDVVTLEPIVSLYLIWDGVTTAHMFLTPDNYYKASPNVFRFINFVKDGQPYSFSQFDLRNNRPDIVLQRLGGNNDDVELFNKAWKKRLRRAGIDSTSLAHDYHVPQVTLLNRDAIPSITDKETMSFDLLFEDNLYDLKDINVSINGVSVATKNKVDAIGRKRRIPLELSLSNGVNEIAFSCTNSSGTSSLPERVVITSNRSKLDKPDIYIVSIGVSEYADKDYNLKYAHKDALDFTRILKNNKSQSYREVKSMTLQNKEFSYGSIEKIKEFIKDAKIDDIVILFYAGHGVLDNDLDYYLSMSSMDFNNPSNGGMQYDDFVALLDDTQSLNRYVFIDACHSGEFDKEDYIAVNTVALPSDSEIVFRSAGNDLKMKEKVERINAVLQENFMDLRLGTGATILSSAAGGELAVESDELKNGLFTYCLIKGLNSNEADLNGDGKITFTEWINYTRSNVGKISEGRQSPSLRSNNYHANIQLK